MRDEPADGVSYSTELPEWIEQEARRLRRERLLSNLLLGGEITAWALAVVIMLALIF